MNITVNGYDLSPAVISGVTEGTNAYERLTFTFDASWDGLIKTVTFYTPDRDVVCLVAEDTVLLPAEVTRQSGVTRYVICGTDGEKTVMSTEGAIKISDTLNVDEDTFERKTPGAIETITQYIKKITDAYDAAHANAQNVAQMADSAERAASAAGDFRDGAATAQTNAENFASRALQSAQSASLASNTAHASAESAIVSAQSAQSAADSAQSFSESAQSASDAAHASSESAIVSAQNAQSAADSAKEIYDFVAGRDPVIGRFANYEQTDVRLRSDGWLGYVKSDAGNIYFRFENPLIASDDAFIFRMWIDSDEVYQIRINEKGDCVIYRSGGETIPLSGEFVGKFDKSVGYIELRLSRAIVGLSGAKYLKLNGNSVLSTNSFGEIAKFPPFDTPLQSISAQEAAQRCEEIAADAPIRKIKSVSASASDTSVTVSNDTDNRQFDVSEFYARVTFRRPSGDTAENPIEFLVTGASSPIGLPVGSASERSFFIHGEVSDGMLFISLFPENGTAGFNAGCVFTEVSNGIRSFEISRSGGSELGGTTVDIWGRDSGRM